MGTTLAIRFILGRVHANPWGHHVNEGHVDFPPSPWRLLRSLYATWKTRAPDLDGETVHALLRRLAEPPTYFVPPFQLGHTRHYYPDSQHREGATSTDATLDAFAILERDAELAICWPFTLPADQHAALSRIAGSLPYLGRADSLCEARVVANWQPTPQHTLCAALDLDDDAPGTDEGDQFRLLAPTMPLDLDALIMRPVDIRARRLLYPPSSHQLTYSRPAEAMPTRQPRRPARRTAAVEAVRFSILGRAQPPHSRVNPPLTEAVILTDRLRGSAVAKLNEVRGNEHLASLLVGRDGDTLMRGHQHAHYLALPDADRRIASLAVWAPGGLADDELRALSRIEQLLGHENAPGPGTLLVRMAGYGTADDVLPDLAIKATTWRSVTPFIAPRHPKRHQHDYVRAELRKELDRRGLPNAVNVEFDRHPARTIGEYTRQRPSQRRRTGQPTSNGLPGAHLIITSPVPIAGPLALGHLSHFGLGLFAPMP
jgi:CRISPR-associated protein Csb2